MSALALNSALAFGQLGKDKASKKAKKQKSAEVIEDKVANDAEIERILKERDRQTGVKPTSEAIIEGHHFPKGTVWLNTDGPFAQNNFDNKITLIVVSDFDCVDCAYYLTTLQESLKQTPAIQIIQVIKGDANAPIQRNFVLQYIQQFGFNHPIAVVPDFSGFSGSTITQVPFFMLYEKKNTPVFAQGGIAGFDDLVKKIDTLKSDNALLQSCYNYQVQPSVLFDRWADPVVENPTALATDDELDRIYVNDAAHNRIVELDGAGNCTAVIGSNRKGFADDNLANSLFDHIQGICFQDGKLYLADTYNHRIRVADIASQRVYTLCGNGQNTIQKANEIKSGLNPIGLPVGLTFWNKNLYAISASTNELFEVNPQNGNATKFADLPEGRNGLMRIWPRSIVSVKDYLYVAMSDGSLVQLDKKGGIINFPTNKGFQVHTIGEWKGQLIATSVKEQRVMLMGKGGWRYIAGDGFSGNKNGPALEAKFNAPSGLAVINGELFIADRENHQLRTLSSSKKGTVRSFSLQLSRELIGETAAHTFGEMVVMDTIMVSKSESKIHVALDLGNFKLVPDWSYADIDEVSGAYLPTQEINEDGFVFGVNNRFEGLDVYIEVYLTVEDPDKPGIYIAKRSYLVFYIERVKDAPAKQEQVYTVNVLPY